MRTTETSLRLGDVVHDIVSGYAGTVTARVEKLHGTVEFLVESEATPQGRSSEVRVYVGAEVARLKVIMNSLHGALPKGKR